MSRPEADLNIGTIIKYLNLNAVLASWLQFVPSHHLLATCIVQIPALQSRQTTEPVPH